MPKSYSSAALTQGGEGEGKAPPFAPGPLAKNEALDLIEMLQGEFPALRAEVRWTPRAMDARCFDRRVLVNLGPKMLLKGERAMLHELAHALVTAEVQAIKPHGPLFEDALARIITAYYGTLEAAPLPELVPEREAHQRRADDPKSTLAARPTLVEKPDGAVGFSFVEMSGEEESEVEPRPRKGGAKGPLRRKSSRTKRRQSR